MIFWKIVSNNRWNSDLTMDLVNHYISIIHHLIGTFWYLFQFQMTDPLVLYAQEEEPKGVKVGHIRACDKDQNAKLYFSITCRCF